MKRKSPKPAPKPTAKDVAQEMIVSLSLERERLRNALRDLFAYYDRRENSGWTAADVQRIAAIRDLIK